MQFTSSNFYKRKVTDSSVCRLNTQHIYLTKIAYGGKLLYGDDLSLGPNSRVLDSGTGSGQLSSHSI